MTVIKFSVKYILKSKNGQFYVVQPTIDLSRMAVVKIVKESHTRHLAIIETH